jgi:hypothetical protein
MTTRACWLAVVSVAIAGCATSRGYEGPQRPADEVAIVQGDLRFNAGSPLSLVLRSVDGRPLNARYNGVELLPGEHTFIVDCVLRETRVTTRHEVTAELDPGARYGFTADVEPAMRGCRQVELTRRN